MFFVWYYYTKKINAEWLLTSVKNANNYRTAYTYDNRNRTTSVYADRDNDGTADSSEEKVQYTYTNNRLTGITTATSSYTIVYDAFGNMTQVKAGNNVLATYTYGNHNGKLQSVTDGNGNTESYVYDELDRTVSVLYNGNALQSYVYDANGAIAEIKDQKAGITHTYEYDSLGRLIRAWQKDTATGEKVLAVENLYDSYGRADKSTYVVGDRTLSYELTYKTESNLVGSILMPNADVMSAIHYAYDDFERLTQKSIYFSMCYDIREEYEYETYTDGVKTYISSLVSTLTLNAGNTTAQYSYTYDLLGNITEICKNGTTVSRYEYDALNQLVREDDCAAGTATIFTYDKAGNITAKYVFPWVNSPSSILMSNVSGPEDADSNYTYSSSAWGDLLTGYNGTTINYDDIGNPTNWRNARIMMWDGKQLTAFTRDALNHSLSFSYNADGIRTRKTNSDRINGQRVNDTHDYILDGTNIVRELIMHTVGTGSYATTTTKTLYYLYDASGSVAGLIYNGNVYYFQKNIQGDIIRICNAGGDTVVEYTYDAWGKALSVTGTLASTLGQDNPFRYRGYYYDTETGFYYLQTRYYDPEVGRFLNADVIIGANGDIPGYNMFAYCSNNPVVRIDSNGQSWWIFANAVVGAVVGAVSKIVSNVASGEEWYDVVIGATFGGAAYNIVLATTGSVSWAGYVSSAVESATNQLLSYVPGVAQLNGNEKAQEFTKENIKSSIKNIMIETAINGTISTTTGLIAKKMVPTNNGWFTPQKFVSSFAGSYATKSELQTMVQGIMTSGVSICHKKYESNRGRKTEPVYFSDLQFYGVN